MQANKNEVGQTLNELTADILKALAAKLTPEQNVDVNEQHHRSNYQHRRPNYVKQQQQQSSGQPQQKVGQQQQKVGQQQQKVGQQQQKAGLPSQNKNTKQTGNQQATNNQTQQSARWQKNGPRRPNNPHGNNSPVKQQPHVNNQNQTNAKGKGGIGNRLSPKELGLSKIRNNEKVLILMRGCPGSGKTTLAYEMKHNGVVISADNFFMRNGRYEFDPSKLNEAHSHAQRSCKQEMERNLTPIIIDNTNLEAWEMMPYINLAVKNLYFVLLLEPETKWKYNAVELAARNTHRVTYDKILSMLNSFDRNITAFHLLKSSKVMANVGPKQPLLSSPQIRNQAQVPSRFCQLDANKARNMNRPNSATVVRQPQIPIPIFVSNATNVNPSANQNAEDDGWSSNEEEWKTMHSKSNTIKRSTSVPDMLKNAKPSTFHNPSPFMPIHLPQPESAQQSSYYNDLLDLDFSLSTLTTVTSNLQPQSPSISAYNVNGLLGISKPNSLPATWEIPTFPGSQLQVDDAASDEETEDFEGSSDAVSKTAEFLSSESENEEDPFKTLKSFFAGVPEDALTDIYERCKGDIQWVVNLLLDAGYEMKVPSRDDEQDENETIPNEVHEDLLEFNDLKLSDDVPNPSIKIPLISVSAADETGLGAAALPSVSPQQQPKELDNFNLRMDAGFAHLLQENFGPVEYLLSSSSYSASELDVEIPFELAGLIHECWARTLKEKFAKEDAEILQMMTDEDYARMIQDEDYAQKIQDEEYATNPGLIPIFGVEDFPTLDGAGNHFNSSHNVKQWMSSNEDLALKIKRKQLYDQFPQIDRKAIDDIMESNNSSYGDTVNTLKLLYEPEELPKSVIANNYDVEQFVQKHQPRKEEKRNPPIDPTQMRNTAQHFHLTRQFYFEKAKSAYQSGLKEVASYYSQKAHGCTEIINMNNQRACEMILEITNSGKNANTLDLHLLTIKEARKAVAEFLSWKQTELNANNDGRVSLDVYIITGRGKHSTDGVSRIKPAVKQYLTSNKYHFKLVNVGCIEVTLSKRTG